MSGVFASYSRYYDLFYGDKDYASESEYVLNLARRHHGPLGTVIDLGCGTGRHATEFSGAGLTVLGVDRSPHMVAEAKARCPSLASGGPGLEFAIGDVRDFHTDRRFDLATSLFHVMSYQVEPRDVLAVFSCVNRLLNPGGLFVFDFWHGPGVLECPPSTRVRRLEHRQSEIIRISEPTHDPVAHRVDIAIDVISLRDGSFERHRETHAMRYFFLPELDGWLSESGFERVSAHGWMQEREPDGRDWYACVVARRRDDP